MALELRFLGGASEVGASCVALRFDNAWLVVDAGVRMSGTGNERLPDFSPLAGENVAAMIITHAHADHIGALPILHRMFPTAPIYATAATTRLMSIMLADAVAVMEKRAAEELELPLYDGAAVEQMLQHLTPLTVNVRHPIPAIPGLVVSLRLAGHIAGAVSVGLEHPDGRVVISGDISIAPQRTIQGAEVPLVTNPDLLILESTYGARRHALRRDEERRLASEVAAAIRRGGHVLIPAFALGRAQEVILILQEAQRRREIPQFTVWVDGLVRRVCAAYSTIPFVLNPALRQRIVRGQQVFFTETIHMVEPAQRKTLINGAPSCIIASSGMLSGGPSRWYAEQLLGRSDATIGLTGYQDEESPGRALQQVAAGTHRSIVLGQQTVDVAAQVMTYYLSGHADQAELVEWAQQIRPRMVALVHGDGEARNGLAEALRYSGMSVVVPPTGEVLQLATTRRPNESVPVIAEPPALPQRVRHAAPISPDALAEVLWETEGKPVEPVVIEVREVTRCWYGVEGAAEEIQGMVDLLDSGTHRFLPITALTGFYRLNPPATVRKNAPVTIPRVGSGSLMLVKLFNGQVIPWFCQRNEKGILIGTGPSRVTVNQPITARDVVVWVGHWAIPEGAASDAQQRVIDDWMLQSSTHRSHVSPRTVATTLNPEQRYDLSALVTAVGGTADDLGWRLHIARMIVANPQVFTLTPARHPLEDARWAIQLANDWKGALAEARTQPRPDMVAIQQQIDYHLQGAKDLYRRSIDPDTGNITLRFRFPLTAEKRYRAQLAALRVALPIPIEINQETDLEALRNLIHEQLRPLVTIKGIPSIDTAHRVVTVVYYGEPNPKVIESTVAQITLRTGFTLDLRPIAPPLATQKVKTKGQGKVEGNDVQAMLTVGTPAEERCDRMTAQSTAEELLAGIAHKVDLNHTNDLILVRLPLPYRDIRRYRSQLEEVAQRTGWAVRVRPNTQHNVLEEEIHKLLPEDIELLKPLSFYVQQQRVEGRYRGTLDTQAVMVIQTRFQEITGWQLILYPAK